MPATIARLTGPSPGTPPGPSVGVGMQAVGVLEPAMVRVVISAAAAMSLALLLPAATSIAQLALTGQAGMAPIA